MNYRDEIKLTKRLGQSIVDILNNGDLKNHNPLLYSHLKEAAYICREGKIPKLIRLSEKDDFIRDLIKNTKELNESLIIG